MKKVIYLSCLLFATIGFANNEMQQELRNLEFYSKIYGSVRYFYPSKEAQQIDWTKFSVYGVQKVMHCKNDQELIKEINALFLPLCNELKINVPDKDDFYILSKGEKRKIWEHHGSGKPPYVGVLLGIIYKMNPTYYSKTEKIKQGDTVFFYKEYVDKDLYYSIPTASNENKVSEEFKKLKKSVDSISLEGINLETREGFINFDNPAYQLATIITTWNNMRFFFPYPIATDWDSLQLKTFEKTLKTDDYIEFYNVFREMLSYLNDGHIHTNLSSYGKKNALVMYQKLIFPYMLPYEMYVTDTSAIVVHSDSNWLELIPIGSAIDSVNGKSVEDWINQQKNYMSASEQLKLYELKTKFFDTYTDSVYNITYTINGKQETRTITGIQNLNFKTKLTRKKEKSPFLIEYENGIYQLNLGSREASRKQLKKSLRRLQKEENLKGIIIDFRSYRFMDHKFLGYFSDKNLTSADWQVPVKTRPNEVTYQSSNWKVKSKKKRFSVPIVFITDPAIISYGESVFGIIEHYKLGEIVGLPTAGCNGNVASFETPLYTLHYYTGMKVDKHDGSPLFTIGVTPTIYVENNAGDLINNIDRQLNIAVETILKK